MPCVTELNHLPCLLVPYGDAILDLAQRLFIGLPPPLKVLAATHESLALDRARTTWCSVLRSSPKGVITFARITLFSSFLHCIVKATALHACQTCIPTTTHHLQSQSIWLGLTIITTLSIFFLRITTLSINNLCRFKLYQRRHAVSVLKQNHSPILCCQEMKATAALPTSKPITPSNRCTSYHSVRLACLPTASSIFLTHQISTSHQPPVSQQYFSLTTNQHQPPATTSRTD